MFQKNDKVVCIRDDFSQEARELCSSLPVNKKVYVIRDVVYDSTNKHNHVLLVGIFGPLQPSGKFERGFHQSRFRKLDSVKKQEEMSVRLFDFKND